MIVAILVILILNLIADICMMFMLASVIGYMKDH